MANKGQGSCFRASCFLSRLSRTVCAMTGKAGFLESSYSGRYGSGFRIWAFRFDFRKGVESSRNDAPMELLGPGLSKRLTSCSPTPTYQTLGNKPVRQHTVFFEIATLKEFKEREETQSARGKRAEHRSDQKQQCSRQSWEGPGLSCSLCPCCCA